MHAYLLIKQAKELYRDENLFEELDETVYALDSTTIDLPVRQAGLCLSLFPWAKFRSKKSAIKMHTLLNLENNIPAFISITDALSTMSIFLTN